MPEIAEVARIVHFIRKHLLNKTIAKCTAIDDANIYGKNLTGATTGAEFQKHLTGRKIIGTGQQGKYFWIILDKAPHPVMHFGMSGWLNFRSEETYYYRKKDGQPDQEWPPKFWKFQLETKAEPGEDIVEAAFVDMRRFARIRLVDCPGDQIRDNSPLVENGPDPVVDKDKVTTEWLKGKCRGKKVPIKAMLLDQANISGIGNWVGDEIMYNAKIHPEQYANTLSDAQIEQLLNSIHYVCSTACDVLGDSEKFPEDWLFKHRWGKGKKDAAKTLPNGEKIQFLTVGGRTSAVVPSVQKKTGLVAKEIDEAVSDSENPKRGRATKDTLGGEKSKKRKSKQEAPEEEIKPRNAKAGKVKPEHVQENVDDPRANSTAVSRRRPTRHKA
ncbi:hypothetical protein DV736_g2919, partial [Chaetothyriales sp. CBS 134916]